MSREKETIHLTATSRGWKSKGSKGLGFMKGPVKKSKPSLVKKAVPSKNQDQKPQEKPQDAKPWEQEEKLTFEAWLEKEQKAGTKYESKTAAQKGYDIYTGKAEGKEKPKEKPKSNLTVEYTLWLIQNRVSDSDAAKNKYQAKTGKKAVNP